MNQPIEQTEPRRSRRAGGRSARQALRSAPLAEDIRPVRAGMTGGTYRPLTDADVLRIHHAALDACEQIGFADAPQSGIDVLTGAGAILGDDGRIRIPRAMVEDMLAVAARDITICGQNPKHDLHLSGSKVHFGTAGAAVHVVDVENRTYRESTLQDLYDAARIVEQLDNVHFFQRPMVARDLTDNYLLDINTLYGCVKGTSKHIGTSFVGPENMPGCLEFLYTIAGGEAKFRERPFVSNSTVFVVPPMTFA
ncbi:MAG: trimethylamine methyltransferase family protein, partial [Paracoccaceae bacterium]